MKQGIRWATFSIVALLAARSALGQAKPLASADVSKVYEKLLKQIDQIPIYDNHSHATFPDDPDMDAMASPPDESTVLRLRDDNPEFVAAAKVGVSLLPSYGD